MHVAHDGHARSAFPFARGARQAAGVPLPSPEQAVRRVAELHLRGAAGPLPALVLWPDVPRRPGLLVLYPDAVAGPPDDRPARELCARDGVLVLALRRAPGLREALAAVEWAAEHGFELGGDPGRLAVAGVDAGTATAAAVAAHAHAQGWPPVIVVTTERAA